MFLMNKTGRRMVSTDGRNSCYLVMGEDNKCYSAFMKSGKAKHLKEKLEEATEGVTWRIDTYSLGGRPFFSKLMEDYVDTDED